MSNQDIGPPAKIEQEAKDSVEQQKVEQAERERKMRRRDENPEQRPPDKDSPAGETRD